MRFDDPRRSRRPTRALAPIVPGLLAGLAIALCTWTPTPAETSGSGAAAGDRAARPADLPGELLEAGAGNPTTVARLRVELPQAATFNLRGTLPVPKGLFPRADGLVPWGVQTADGSLFPAQVEVVSWYPKDAQDGADVVEILARVQRPAGTHPGSMETFDIVDYVHSPRRVRPTPAVASLLTGTKKVLVRSRDVFGNLYELDLMNGGNSGKRILRDGRVAFQFRSYGVLRPKGASIGAPTGALTHLMGVHAYMTYWAVEDVVTLDLRISNGASGADPTPLNDPQDDMYFESIELVTPQGWTAQQLFDDPFWGTPSTQGGSVVQPIVAPLSGGAMHLMPKRSQFNRRLVLTTTGNGTQATEIARSAGLGFCTAGKNAQGQDLWSWWNPQTARYFPTNNLLPDLDWIGESLVSSNQTSQLNNYENLLASGTNQGNYPIFSDVLGWAHPWGVKYGGMTGGSEIYPLDGIKAAYAAAVDGYLMTQITHRMYMDRQPIAFFNSSGDPSAVEDWLLPSPIEHLPFNYFKILDGSDDPPNWNSAPSFQVNYVQQNGLAPAYEADLKGHKPIDQQHFIRYTRSPKVLTWLGNDAMAKDDVVQAAEAMRLSYGQYPTSASGYVSGPSLLADVNSVAAHPGVGFAFGRGEAWSIDTVNAAYAIGTPGFRAKVLPWYAQILDTVEAGQQDCTGIIQSIIIFSILGGQHSIRQAPEQTIIAVALTGMLESVLVDANPSSAARLQTVITDSMYGLLTGASWHDPQGGPWISLAVDDLNPQTPPYCGFIPPGGTAPGVEKIHVHASLEFGWRLTGDPLSITRASQVMGTNQSPQAILVEFEKTYFSYLENRAPIIAALQELSQP